ncbi:MAG: hypothetical protein K2F79_04940, partial [Muribaculaceae bacterium]|nr:hypothetical protein [Muribaculaceae bacterium]
MSRILAFSSSAAFPEPTFQGIVENQDIHAMSAPQYLIITTEGMRQYAEELAQIHRTLRGTNVLVLTQDEIFNEFSSGARCPQALRRCIKMFHDRQPGTLTHVLLYGRSHFDQRGIISDRSDRLVCYEMEYINYVIDSTQNAIADTYFGLVDDAYTPLDIFRFPSVVSIGRIPADTPEKARTANEKSRQYMLNPPSPSDFLHALMMSDLHDAHAHFLQSEASIDTMAKVRPEFTFSRADGLVYPISDNELKEAQKQTANCLRRGQGYMSYCGHGQPSFIGSLKLWSENLAKETDYSVLPLCLLASCNLFMPDRDYSSLAETMLFKEGGGAIGVIAACRAVYLEQNKVLSNAIAAQYANARPGTTIGEIFRNARLEIISKLPLSAATGVNTICYNLCGDPALPLAVPDHIVDITSINGSTPAEASLPSLVPVAISARILDPEGRPVTDFSGTVCIEVFDAPRTFSTNAAEADDPDSNGRPQSRTALCDEYLLAEHTAQASEGTVSTVIYLPEPTANGQKGRIVITASDPSRGINAAGTVRDVTLSGPGEGHTPAQAPQVLDMYIDTPGFRSGDPVSDSFVLYAQIDCSSTGLDMSNSRIKNGISLVPFFILELL